MIEVSGLRKSFGDQLVLGGVDFEVSEATIFALLGPTGAGKTTIVHILSTLIGADAGELRVAGHDVARDTMGAGLAGVSAGRDEYLDYVTPGILLIAAAGAAQGVAISVAIDMTEGIIARFRTMDIARVSVLTGHVVGSLIQTMVAMAVVIGFALLLGFGPTAGPPTRCPRACAPSPSTSPSRR